MIGSEGDQDARRVAQHEQRIEEHAEEAVELQQVIVHLLGIGTVAMPDRVERGQRDGENVGAIHNAPQSERLHVVVNSPLLAHQYTGPLAVPMGRMAAAALRRREFSHPDSLLEPVVQRES